MSKKNNQNTRRKQHAFDMQREAAAKKKAAAKAATQQKALAAKPKDMKQGKKTKGIRIRKHVVVAVREWLSAGLPDHDAHAVDCRRKGLFSPLIPYCSPCILRASR